MSAMFDLWGKLLFIQTHFSLWSTNSTVFSFCVAGELVGLEDTAERSREEAEKDMDQVDWSQEAAAARFVSILMELGADKIFNE